VEGPPENLKSDVPAKEAFCRELLRRGYSDARIVGSPADILATKDGEAWYFEIKFTRTKKPNYFGAATLTEWIPASRNPARFRFVVAYESADKWLFDEYTVEQFMTYSYVPPFKIYFNVPVPKQPNVPSPNDSKRTQLTEARLKVLGEFFDAFRAPG
jgi:hypothetical protein